MNKKNIIFLVTSFSHKKFKKFNIEMLKYHEILWITVDPFIYSSFKRKGFENVKLINFQEIKKEYEQFNMEKINQLLKHYKDKYNIINIRNWFLADNTYKMRNVYKKYNSEEYYIKLISLFKCFETFLLNYPVDVIFQWMGAELERRVLRAICDKEHIFHLMFTFSPITGHFIFVKDEYMRKYNIKINNVNIGKAKEYIEEYKSKKLNFIAPRRQKLLTFINFKKFLNANNKIFYLRSMIRSIIRIQKNQLENIIKFIISQWLYQKLPKNKKFISYPLHYTVESQVTVRSNNFIDQIILIKLISLNIPDNYQLLVKGHPNSLGEIKLNDLVTIRNLPNVYLVNPEISAHDLIKLSDIVIVVNSTVGFEAILYQKPVITFGKSIYIDKGLTLDVKAINDLPLLLEKAKNFCPKYEDIALFVKNLMDLSIKGNFENPQLLVQNLNKYLDIYFKENRVEPSHINEKR